MAYGKKKKRKGIARVGDEELVAQYIATVGVTLCPPAGFLAEKPVYKPVDYARLIAEARKKRIQERGERRPRLDGVDITIGVLSVGYFKREEHESSRWE